MLNFDVALSLIVVYLIKCIIRVVVVTAKFREARGRLVPKNLVGVKILNIVALK